MIKTLIMTILAPLIFIWNLLRALIIRRVRLRQLEGTIFFNILKDKGRCLAFNEEITDKEMPKEFAALCYVRKLFCFVSVEERLLRAGYTSVDNVMTITLFRWQFKRLLNLIKLEQKIDEKVPVYILQPWDAEKIGEIFVPKELDYPYVDKDSFEEVERSVQEVVDKKRNKLGVLLYGSPGNGKSYYIRYLALKYKMPIYIVSFVPDIHNHAMIRMFSRIEKSSIILFEDFDSYFDNKKCLMKEAKFTFDVLLNVIDGTYSTCEGLLFMMTANDIEKVDKTLRKRPSRFKYIKEISDPNEEIRMRIFDNNSEVVVKTNGMSLDEILHYREENKTKIVKMSCESVSVGITGEEKK